MAPPVQHPFLILILAIDYHYSHVVDSPATKSPIVAYSNQEQRNKIKKDRIL